jgi:hypothetical protein
MLRYEDFLEAEKRLEEPIIINYFEAEKIKRELNEKQRNELGEDYCLAKPIIHKRKNGNFKKFYSRKE